MVTVGNGELLWTAVAEAVANIAPLEKAWDDNKLEKTIRGYFNKGAKNLNFRSNSLWELINTYSDNVFSSLFASLGDREWLFKGQADFILVMDAGIKDNFPQDVLMGIQPHEFEQYVLAAHDRAFEEQRFGPILQEAMAGNVQGPKTKKRVWNAVEQGRKEAAHTSVQMEDFTACWINRAIAVLSQEAHGEPESVLSTDTAVQLFHSLIEGGGLPLSMTQEAEPPPRWPLVDEAVQTAYITHTASGDGAGSALGFASAAEVGGSAPCGKGAWAVADGPAAKKARLAKGVGKAPFSAW